MKTREQQIRNKAKELGQQYFPDSANIWARANVEAAYVESACIEMAEWLDSHPHWIPVEERLPHENQRVLVYNGIFNEVHLCDYYDGKFEDYYGLFRKGVATHWMPLPQPPRKEDKK